MPDAAKEIQKRKEFVNVSEEEMQKVDAAIEELKKDPHAPRNVSVTLTVHVHNEYPKTLYKGKEVQMVADADAEEAAAEAGFGPYDHEAFTAKEA